MRGLTVAASIFCLFVLGSPWGAAKPGAGEFALARGDAVEPLTPAPAMETDSPGYVIHLSAARAGSQTRHISYWVREMRRRWHEERAAGKARARTIRQLRAQLERDPTVGAAICAVFGPYCGEARRVAWCESRYFTGAQNGQYRGLFQMGSYARSAYGHGFSPLTQSLAAFRYFVAAGRDWSPWECQP